jgi:MraZ protein
MKWGSVPTARTGVAGLLPLRHFGPEPSTAAAAQGRRPWERRLAFRGHYEHSLDVKNRLSIPARFRAAFSSGVVLAKDPEPCVAVWTPDTHEEIIRRALGDLNPMGAQYRTLSRFYQGNSFEVELDAAGRVTLPPPLLAHAGVDREVVVVGVGDHLEVWSRERWQRQQEALDAEIKEVTERLGNPS